MKCTDVHLMYLINYNTNTSSVKLLVDITNSNIWHAQFIEKSLQRKTNLVLLFYCTVIFRVDWLLHNLHSHGRAIYRDYAMANMVTNNRVSCPQLCHVSNALYCIINMHNTYNNVMATNLCAMQACTLIKQLVT